MSKIHDETQNFDARLSVIQALALGVFLLLGVRFWVLQVVNHEAYASAALSNSIRDIPIPAARGNILDRNGKILVDSRPAYSLKINREDLKNHKLEDTLPLLQRELGVDPDYARQQISDPLAPKSRPVTIKLNLTEADRAWVEAHEMEYPELHVELEPQRIYPLGQELAHMLGYVGQISPTQLKADPPIPEFEGARSGDIVGQSGIERSHNQILSGTEGSRRVIVDSSGRFVRELERIEPVPGQDLYTTIDLDLQNIAEQMLTDTKLKGCAVVMNPQNGEIYAMVSHPSFDPNGFSGGISAQDYAKLANDPDRPLRNRAIQDIYPPGSTWKLVMAMAGLSEGAMKWNEPIPCGGGIQIGNRFAACDAFHGSPAVEAALTHSCNGYFYRVGLRLGVDKIHKWATAMELGQKTGIDLPNETGGYIPEKNLKLRWKDNKRHPNDDDPFYRWTDSDTVNAAIGQGYDRPTPLQMVHAYSGIGMNGHFTTPHLLLKAVTNGVRPEITFEDKGVVNMPLDPVAYEHVMNGLRGVVTSGTATRADVPGFDVCGKTGTAQVVSVRTGASGKFKEHAWFCCFAPMPIPETGRLPEIACVVLVENGGHGGVISAPIAKAIIEAYAQKHHPEMLAGGGAAAVQGSGADAQTDPDGLGIAPSDEDVDEVTEQSANSDTPPDAAPTIVHENDAAQADAAAGAAAAAAPQTQVNPLEGLMRGPDASPPPKAGSSGAKSSDRKPKRSG